MTILELHHAGGNGSVFDRVNSLLVGVSGYPLDLPGRAALRRNPLVTSVAEAIDALVTQALLLLDGHFVVVGHSMGAYLAPHVIARLHSQTRWRCCVFIASSNIAPSRARPLVEADISPMTLSDDAVLAIAQRFGPLPQAILDNEFLRGTALNVMRHDFALCDSVICSPRPLLSCPIDVIAGVDDVYPVDAYADWQLETTGDCRVHVVDGGHFHLVDRPAALAARIHEATTNSTSARR
jgi:surfactin synthase thioesterase subunit